VTARFCVFVEVDAEPSQAMIKVLAKLAMHDDTAAGPRASSIRVTGLRYEPDHIPSYPPGGIVGPIGGYAVGGPSPLDEQNRLMAEFLEVAKKQLKHQKGDDEPWKDEGGEGT
jgi:hypothetical protein